MKKLISVLLSLAMLGSAFMAVPVMASEEGGGEQYAAPASPAVTYNMNVDWKFKKASGTVYPLASAQTSVEKDGKQFYEVDYDDSDWENVSVPHPINAEDTFDGAAMDSGEQGYYRGFMFYRKHVTIPSADEGKKMFLEFEAVRQSVYLWVNGEMVGYYEAGIAPIGFDITDYVNPGEENVIAVATDNSASRGNNNDTRETKPGSVPGAADGNGYQWNTADFNEVQGGITGNVNLYAKGKIYQTLPLYNNLKTTGNYIYGSDYDIDAKSATINVKSEIRNETDADADLTLQVDVVGMDGELAYTGTQTGKAVKAADADAHFMNMVPSDAYDATPADTDISTVDVSYITASFKAENMRFWSDKDPYLYTVYTILKNGDEVIDVQKTVTGFRKVDYDINNGGLLINDKSTYLKGYAQRATNEWAVVGTANDWLTDIDMRLLKESNGNHIRWMHVAPKPVTVRSTDKYGILVTCPAGDKEGDVDGRSWDQRVEAMRDVMIYFRNNPSVLFWEAGNNEITPAHMQEMTDLKAELDPNGGRFAGSRTISSVDQIKAAEYVGTMLNRNAAAAKTSMQSAGGKYMPIMETEYARDEAPRRVWDDFSPPDYDYKNWWLTQTDKKQDGFDLWDETSEDFARINASAYNEFWSGRVGGGGSELYAGAAIMVWSDSNMHNRNMHSENCRTSGKVDAVRIKKEAFYALQAVQSDTPAVDIVGHWSYPPYKAGDRENGNYWYEGTKEVGSGLTAHTEPNGTFLQRDPTKKDVYVIGSPDIVKVELYIDGELIKTNVKPENKFVYKFTEIDVTKGDEVSVKAYNESDIMVAEDAIARTGEPAEVRLTPVTGPDGLIADGSDVMYFDVEVVDEEGNVCPLNYDRLDLELSGNGVLLGGYTSGVGDKITTHKNYTFAECGTNRIFVRSTRDAGKITLKVTHATLGNFEASVDSVAFDNSVDNAEGLSTTMQRSYKADEQPPVVEQKVEAFKPLAAPVKADFSENGNTEVVEDIDTNVYYTVSVNGETLDLEGDMRAIDGSAGISVYGPVKQILEKLKTAGAITDYSITTEDPITLTFSTSEHTYTIKDKINGMYVDGSDEYSEITENPTAKNGDMFVNYSAVIGVIPGVTITKDTEAKTCAITYNASSTASLNGEVSLMSVQGEMSYDHETVTLTSPEAIKGACLIFASYDNGKLVKVVSQNVDLEANKAKYVTVPEEILSSGSEHKAMLWNSLGEMTPICEAKAIVPASTMDPALCETNVLNLTYDDQPNGCLTPTETVGNIFVTDLGNTLNKESRISIDFRFDEATIPDSEGNPVSPTMRFTNSHNKTGPLLSFDGANFRTQTGGSSWQNLGAIQTGKWYRLVIEGTMAIDNAYADCWLYSLDGDTPKEIQATKGMNLRNFGNSSNYLADRLEVTNGISVDNVSVTSLYANTVEVSAVKTDIKANENVMLSATAKRNGAAVTIPEFEWSLYDTEGNPLNDDTIKIENSVLITTAETKTQPVVVRATAKTAGNPYGEVRINITAIDTSHDTFNSIELSSEQDYVRLGEPAEITVSAKMNDAAVTPANDDIVWTVLNEAGIRETGNTCINVTNGKVEVTEDVIPQTITVRASNISGSASADIKLTVKPGTMILDGEEGNEDVFVSGDACEEVVTGREIVDGSWDGSGYYKVTAATDFVGFPSDNSENVLYSADLKFGGEGAGWTIWNNNKGKQGLQVTYKGGKLGIVRDSSNTNTYCSVDTKSWYNVQIMCATGTSPNSYANLIVYKYVDGKRVNPETGEEGKPYVAEGIPMRNLSESTANHIGINPNTCVDNVYCAKIVPDELKASVDKDTMFAGQSIQGTATALRKGVPFGNTLAGLIRWVVYNEDNTAPLGSDLITVDTSGKMTVDAMAEPQTVYLRAQTLDGTLHDEVKVTIQSGDIFAVNKIGFNDDYSKVTQLKVTKNFAYSDTVTFIVAVYDSTETTLKSVTTRKMSAKNIAREEISAIPMDAPMPEGFNKDSDVLYIYTMTSNSENEAVTEADGTIEATFSGNTLSFTKAPAFDASKPVIVMVVKPETVTTSVKDSDVVYIKQVNGADLAKVTTVNIPNAASGSYIIKMAGKINGISEIKTGIAVK